MTNTIDGGPDREDITMAIGLDLDAVSLRAVDAICSRMFIHNLRLAHGSARCLPDALTEFQQTQEIAGWQIIIRDILSSVVQALKENAGAIDAISAERHRQIAKGYDAAHDDGHKCGQIVMAEWGALARVEAAIQAGRGGDVPVYKELLTQAAALCAAEIERVDRASRPLRELRETERNRP